MQDEADHRYFYSREAMAVARDTLVSRVNWFRHAAPVAAFYKIKSSSLLRASPLGETAPPDIEERVGAQILCLWPVGATLRIDRGDVQKFELAVAAANLPSKLSIDWSYGGALSDGLLLLSEEMSPSEIFYRIFMSTGSVGCFEDIPAASLRVRLKSSTPLPSEDWVLIAEADIDEIWLSDVPFDAEAEYAKMQDKYGI